MMSNWNYPLDWASYDLGCGTKKRSRCNTGFQDVDGSTVRSNWDVRLPGPAVGSFVPMKREVGGHIAIFAGRDQCVDIESLPTERPLSFRCVCRPARYGFGVLPIVQADAVDIATKLD